jgi:hypothetical protein
VIRGGFEPHPLGLAAIPRLPVGIFLPAISRQWAVVPFLIDTGATATALGPNDAATRVGIPLLALLDPTLWARVEDFGGIGGSCPHYIQPAEYAFVRDDGTLHLLSGEMAIMQPTNPRWPPTTGCRRCSGGMFYSTFALRRTG